METWKQTHNKLLQISTSGVVRRNEYEVKCGNGFKVIKQAYLKPWISCHGYLKVSFGAGKQEYIHRLLAHAFIPNPFNLPCVNHIDGNKLNNNLSNLEWCTHKHNVKHANDLLKWQHGERNSGSKVRCLDVLEIRRLYISGLLMREIAERYKISRHQVGNIVKGRSWKELIK